MTLTAALYSRISEDPLELEKGVKRQLDMCRELATRNSWAIVGEYADDDISALHGAHRPRYESLMAAVARGEVRVIVTYMTSRLWRNRIERARAITTLGDARVRVVAVRGPDLDLKHAASRGLAGILGELDTMESEIKSERITDAALERAQEGRANGMISYGWRRQYIYDDRGRRLGFKDVADEHQAAIVREIVDSLLDAKSLKFITEDLNARGEPAPAGGKWIYSSVRKVALRPANIGLRTYHGAVIGPAAWPAIVDRDKHDQVTALLGAPERVTSRSGARKHLLTFNTAVGACGVCGAELRSSKVGKYRLYACNAKKSCVGRNEERVDDFVKRVVIGRLSRPDARGLFVRDDTPAREAADRAEALRAQLATAADDHADGLIERSQLHRITAKLRPRIEAAEQEARPTLVGVGPDLIGELTADPAKVWKGMDVVQRHAVLEALGVRVRILPTRQGKGFDPDSVEITWKM